MAIDRPIPSLYCCYLLRSTLRQSALYVGSTPNPVRRLRQHNGLAKGGAVRTRRGNLRPWEMTCIVAGFPTSIAALQFEWAWQNPHITLHIPPSSRISHATQKKRSGHPKRPRHSLQSLLSNLHILLSVPSFSRWPLEVRFFAPDVHKAWLKWSKAATGSLRDTLPIITDFPSAEPEVNDEDGKTRDRSYGIEALKVAYEDTKSHLEKGERIFHSDMKESCDICDRDLQHKSGLYTICPNTDCNSITHLTCLSQHFLQGEKDEQSSEELVPVKGMCPGCQMEVRWNDVVKELSLRTRGQKVVEKLLKPKRVKKGKGIATSQTIVEAEDDEEEEEEEEKEEEVEDVLRRRRIPCTRCRPPRGEWFHGLSRTRRLRYFI
ncbi:uncharacterized protein EAF01_008048 [Botrytis porri]|uniref:GIY-YIG domain-containing protein n=1 Tax=Botrytis porri TaxID=87229 RepID=A0A4Z1KWG1_9HELO|nr:uncharacterized protein EAF01_008048 [Botrytis porri]KAF7898835.1 hypothetical protein EAF01_008048 [Botrytis porri]TGO88884.1 hypothetical protein BPOR_0136g00080 [Botrytis porri]